MRLSGGHIGLWLVDIVIIVFVSNVFVEVEAMGLTQLVARWASNLQDMGSILGYTHVRWTLHHIPLITWLVA